MSNDFIQSVRAEKVQWERVQVFVTGRFENLDAENIDFYLIEKKSEKRIKIKFVKVIDSKFILRVNVTTATEDCREIPDGKWTLVAIDSFTGANYPCTVDEDAIKGDHKSAKSALERNHRVFAKSSVRYYSVCPSLNKNGELYFDVLYEHPPVLSFVQKVGKFLFDIAKPIVYPLKRGMFKAIFHTTSALTKHNGKRVLFTSDSRESMSGNLELVYKRMIERGLDKEYKLNMIFKGNIHYHRKFADKFRMPYLLGRADYIFVDDNDPSVNLVKYGPKVKIIQLWHACGAFKTVGYSRMGKPGGLFINSDNHRIYTNAIVSSSAIAPYYAEAFGIDEDKVYPTGVPRTDVFFDQNYKKQTRERMLDLIPQARGKRVILFGPTFRGSGPKTAYYPTDMIDFDALAGMCKQTNSIVIFKLHFLCKNRIEIPKKYRDIMIDETDNREINDLLFITDVLITDYSSVIYEASTLDIPMLFYAFDLNDYISSRDFYEPYESFVPGRIVCDFDELIDSLMTDNYEQQKVVPFKERNFEFRDGKSTDRVIDWFILDKYEESK